MNITFSNFRNKFLSDRNVGTNQESTVGIQVPGRPWPTRQARPLPSGALVGTALKTVTYF